MVNPLETAARHHFGVTDDLSETGYILSDGTFLDFSGRHEANGYVRKGDRFVIKRGDDHLRHHRYVDHRMLPESITDKLERYDESHASSAMVGFMEATGALRVMPGVGFAVARMPTFESIDAFVRGWKKAYQAAPVYVDILHPESYLEEDAREISFYPDQDIMEKIIEFLEGHFNSPSMGASMNNLQYFANCPVWEQHLPVSELDSMIKNGKEITRKTFLKHVDPDSMRNTEEECGYDRHFPMSKDPFVAYYKSTVRGCPVVFFVWSAMEYVFADYRCVMRKQSNS